ncbi:MAG: sulfotransferase [Gammaproteobacteria bacterium]|nr:sulfotransferase [Gammaproteobacteria bacterium]
MRQAAESATDYRRPYRPRAVALFNALTWRTAGWASMRRLDVQAMVDNAKRRTGLTRFGDESFLPALQALVASINEEAELTPVGVLLQRRQIEAVLANRLRARDLLEHQPEIGEIAIGKVVVITGLARTGTTMLHRLVASHPEIRALKAWEAINPVPFAREGRRGFDRRLRHARMAQRAIGYLAPAFYAVHPVEHDAAEEEVFLLEASFMSQMPAAMMHVPSYARWLEQQDHAASYAYLRTLLQILEWQRRRPYWVLKTPEHMEHLHLLLETFPEATVVQTHRDPLVAVTSFCSMVAHGRGVFSDRVDPAAVAEHWVAKARRMIARSLAARDASEPGRFVDVSYADLLRDPMAELIRIYARSGIPFGDAARAEAERTAARNVQDRFGRHVYRAADFGLDCAGIHRTFGDYQARFGIAREVRS